MSTICESRESGDRVVILKQVIDSNQGEHDSDCMKICRKLIFETDRHNASPYSPMILPKPNVTYSGYFRSPAVRSCDIYFISVLLLAIVLFRRAHRIVRTD